MSASRKQCTYATLWASLIGTDMGACALCTELVLDDDVSSLSWALPSSVNGSHDTPQVAC